MDPKIKKLILYSTILIVGIVFLIYGLVKGRGFLIPFTMAAIFSMMLLPVEGWFRKIKIPRGLAVFLADLMLMSIVIGLMYIIGLQLKSITENRETYEKSLKVKIEKLHNFVSDHTGISEEKSQKILNLENWKNKADDLADDELFSRITNFTGKFLLLFVYIFFFMYYRQKFKKAILGFVPEDKRSRAEVIFAKSTRITRRFLFGKFIIMIFLAVIYALGMALIGLKHAVLVAVLASVLTLIPYIGNVLAVGIAISMSLLSGGTFMTIVWILVLFSITQFFESYFFQPFIVGHKVDLNPVTIILVVVIGGSIWGFAGMFLAVPVVGIIKVIFNNVPILRPAGYLLDERDTGAEENWMFRLKDRIVSRFKD